MSPKSNQKGCQQKCFFAHKAFALQNCQNRGWNYFALTLFALAAKTSYALPPHSPALFWPFSPEAVLLTGKEKLS
ncbi:hypothetical protein [Mucilaginibacter sp. FT3.2]|uniref:hypothetical protein n=1 Tax=Mucilaginibacter sp. FT3.2 TaxID=2723090 RepID=UPI00161B04D6|nr:hypothetical protein [Mucilaginibacter sp. FT3.2]MBB6229958.1 hypothetical protein [Mucilaginibacter sp. FT3.2]